jgi:hypothetical protein
MISVKVVQLNGNRLAKIRRELNYVSTDEFFRTIPLADFESLVEKKLRSLSPTGKSRYRSYLQALGYPSERTLKDGWRVKRETRGSKIEFTVWNLLETIGGKSGKAKFNALEYGSNASEWIAKRMFRFKIGRQWVTIAQGRSVSHAGNEGAHAQERTREYIEQVLLPKIGTRIENLIAKRLK